MILIDVRTKEEFENNHIDKATNHNIMDMMEGIFPVIDKNDDVGVYCESGNRSMMAKNLIKEAGFKKVTDLGGIDNLRK